MPTLQIWLKDEELRQVIAKAKTRTIMQFCHEAIMKEAKK